MRDYSFDIMKIDWYCLLQLAWGCKALVVVDCRGNLYHIETIFCLSSSFVMFFFLPVTVLQRTKPFLFCVVHKSIFLMCSKCATSRQCYQVFQLNYIHVYKIANSTVVYFTL
jgi:hypothetical protein